MKQLELFAPPPALPAGLKYQHDLFSIEEQEDLAERIRTLPLRAFAFKGYVGKRRTASFGWSYDFEREELREASPIPSFLRSVRERAADFAGLAAAQFQHVLVTEYGAGAGIGWHRDKAVFGDVVGISLLSSCSFRLRRRNGAAWERASFTAEPGSAYLLRGPARTEWEHSIPAVETLRYSITFRSIRAG